MSQVRSRQEDDMGGAGTVVVVGGGAAGLVAAVACARVWRGPVLVLEKNTAPGRKLLLTGAGRCNLANTTVDEDCFPGRGGDEFVTRLLARWPYEEIRRWFENLGLALVEGPDGRVFPVTDRAQSVLEVLELALRDAGVKLLTGVRVTELVVEGRGLRVVAGDRSWAATRVILATGGRSHPRTGSSGEGLELARRLGLAVATPVPALVPLRARLGDLHALQGQRWRCGLGLVEDGRRQALSEGDVLVTDYGLSGLGVLDVTARAPREAWEGVTLSLDLFPGSGGAAGVAELLERRARAHPGWSFGEILTGLLPQKVVAVVGRRVDARLAAAPASRWPRSAVAEAGRLLTDVRVEVTGSQGWEQAQVGAGGVLLREVDPDGMEARGVRGLHVVGELLDIHGLTGGYNLHLAWATGLAAGAAAAARGRS